MDDFRKFLQKGRKFYDEWRRLKSYCPVFCEVVLVSKLGWQHIVNERRLQRDVLRRLKLLPYAKYLLEKTTTFQNIRVGKNIIYYEIQAILYIEEVGMFKKVIIIVSEKDKKKYFFSVMDESISSKVSPVLANMGTRGVKV